MTSMNWARRDRLFRDWEEADGRLLGAVRRFPLDSSSLERSYHDERRAMTRLIDFDRQMGLTPAGRQAAPQTAVA
jgi:hypothetical protein